MRRFSQRHSLVTLSEINITPLLDLAFVLLIIFVITTPLLEQGLNLRLPAGDTPDNRKVDKSDIRVIEISPSGSGIWQALATQRDGGRLLARIDDAVLPAGGYVLRARASDLARNELSAATVISSALWAGRTSGDPAYANRSPRFVLPVAV